MNNQPLLHAIDANVILRFLVGDDRDLFAKSRLIVAAVESGEIVGTCDPVNLAEVVWVLWKFYKVPNHKIKELLDPIIKNPGFVIPDKDRYIMALQLFSESVDHFGDACACATAILECEGRLLSFDRELSRVKGITRKESMG
jgi:predicted nucleic-acid-binding protein